MLNNFESPENRVDESQQLGPIITAPEMAPARLARILSYSYLVDLALVFIASQQGIGAELSFNWYAHAALFMVCLAVVARWLIARLDIARLSLEFIAIKRSKVKLIFNLLACIVVIIGVLSVGISIKLVPVVVFATLVLKASGILVSILLPPDASPVLRLNAASKLLVLIEFFPWFVARGAVIPVIVGWGVFVNGSSMALIIGFLSAQLWLKPGGDRFSARCVKCHRLVHKLIILAFGYCVDCKRFELGKKRT